MELLSICFGESAEAASGDLYTAYLRFRAEPKSLSAMDAAGIDSAAMERQLRVLTLSALAVGAAELTFAQVCAG